MATTVQLNALRSRLAKGGIEPEHLAALISEQIKGQIANAEKTAAANHDVRQRLWDQLFTAALGGIAAAWEWGHTEPIRAAEYAARLADAALTVRDRRNA